MSKLKIFLMTKNDLIFIEDWIIYHGYLFGLENLYLIDGSDDPKVLELYEFYEEHGLNVHRTSTDLNGLEAEITELMHQHKGEDSFLIKMDTDEFLAYSDSPLLVERVSFRGIFCRIRRFIRRLRGRPAKQTVEFFDFVKPSHEKLRNDGFDAFFQTLSKVQCAYKAGVTMNNIPSHQKVVCAAQEIELFTEAYVTDFKAFFHSSGFRSMDLGGHFGNSHDPSRIVFTGLAVIHYYCPSIADYAQRAKQVLLSHGFLCEGDSLEVQKAKLRKLSASPKVVSWHKIVWYLDYLENQETAQQEEMGSLGGSGNVRFTLVRNTLDYVRQKSDFPICSSVV